MMRAGFQVTIHAIGDRANREALDVLRGRDARSAIHARDTRPRIEHAQVVSPADVPRFAALGVIASMQPSHAVEDMAWAEARIGPERIKGAYAWRSLRRAGRADDLQLGSAGHRLQHLLRAALGRDAHGSQRPARRRLAPEKR